MELLLNERPDMEREGERERHTERYKSLRKNIIYYNTCFVSDIFILVYYYLYVSLYMYVFVLMFMFVCVCMRVLFYLKKHFGGYVTFLILFYFVYV